MLPMVAHSCTDRRRECHGLAATLLAYIVEVLRPGDQFAMVLAYLAARQLMTLQQSPSTLPMPSE